VPDLSIRAIERLANDTGWSCRRLDWFHIGGQAWFVFFQPGLEVEIDAPARLNHVAPIKDTFRPTARDRIGFLDPR
jgi:hypothetical protein